jgi:hypothetical protein
MVLYGLPRGCLEEVHTNKAHIHPLEWCHSLRRPASTRPPSYRYFRNVVQFLHPIIVDRFLFLCRLHLTAGDVWQEHQSKSAQTSKRNVEESTSSAG